MIYRACRFLFCQFFQWGKPHRVMDHTDALPPFDARPVRCLDINSLHTFPQGAGWQFYQFLIPVRPLNELI